MGLIAKIPQGVVVPDSISIEEPPRDLPEKIRAFFGSTGKWWGTWASPQVKGGYDAILVIKKIKNGEEAEVAYCTPDYPKWYIEKGIWEATGKFVEKESGKIALLIPYERSHTHIECWFEGKEFKGIMYGRFMLSRITWNPLP